MKHLNKILSVVPAFSLLTISKAHAQALTPDPAAELQTITDSVNTGGLVTFASGLGLTAVTLLLIVAGVVIAKRFVSKH